MTSDLNKVRRYYDSFDEWQRLETPAGLLEYERTLATLDRYLAPHSRILDLGGGPGRYTILSTRGFAYGREAQLLRIQANRPDLYNQFLAAISATASDPTSISLGGHALYIGQKPPT